MVMDNVLIAPPEGRVSAVHACLLLLFMFELGDMACGCTVVILSSTLT